MTNPNPTLSAAAVAAIYRSLYYSFKADGRTEAADRCALQISALKARFPNQISNDTWTDFLKQARGKQARAKQ